MTFGRATIAMLASLGLVVLVVGGTGLWVLVEDVERGYVDLHGGGALSEAARVAQLLELDLARGLSEAEILNDFQDGLVRAPRDPARFLCLVGGGRVLCHPDETMRGSEVEAMSPADPGAGAGAGAGPGLLRTPDGRTEIVHHVPVEGTDWLVSVHTDRAAVSGRVAGLRDRILGAAIPGFLLIVVLGAFAARGVARRHDRRIAAVNSELERHVERRTAQLTRLNRRFRALFESAPTAMFVTRADGTIARANSGAARLLGRSVAEIRGAAFSAFCRVGDDEAPGDPSARRGVVERADGRPRQVEVRESRLGERDGALRLLVVRDVTKQRRLEQQLRQSQKLEAMGRLAGGIAHDFNNVLTAILGYGDMLVRGLEEGSRQRRHAGEIVQAAERADHLTRQLLAFSRKQVMAPRPDDLNAVVDSLRAMLDKIIGEDVGIRTELEPGLATVHMDRGQIEQAVVNLAVNARDAMPEGGTLTLRTRTAPVDPQGPAVYLEVEDEGTGIEPEVREQMFEPFFTTRRSGRGTGLGLAMVLGVVEQHGGTIEVESELGRGSTFRIRLPATPSETAWAPAPSVASETPRGDETILVVEDEDAVRRIVRATLTSLGYTAICAPQRDAALAEVMAHDGPIHLVLSDVVMPGMDAVTFGRKIGELLPDVAWLYVSGYPDREVPPGPDGGPPPFLRKPFNEERLARAVRRAIDDAPLAAAV